MEDELIGAGRTLIYDVFTTGKTQHPMWDGQFRAKKCKRTLARRLAQAMRYRQGNHAEFRALRGAGILADDEVSLTEFFVEVLETFREKLGYSDKERCWFIKVDKARPARRGVQAGGSRLV